MIAHGTAYFKFRQSPIGPSTRLKTNNNEVLNILMKENVYNNITIKGMAEGLTIAQNDNWIRNK